MAENNKVGRPLKYKNKEEIDQAIKAYFERCEESGKPLTMSGLAVWLDMDRRSLVNYGNREEFFLSIKRARAMIEASTEERMLMNELNVTGAIFSLKNNYGWVDKQEIKEETDNKITISWEEDED